MTALQAVRFCTGLSFSCWVTVRPYRTHGSARVSLFFDADGHTKLWTSIPSLSCSQPHMYGFLPLFSSSYSPHLALIRTTRTVSVQLAADWWKTSWVLSQLLSSPACLSLPLLSLSDALTQPLYLTLLGPLHWLTSTSHTISLEEPL